MEETLNLKWYEGPSPEIGWWPASTEKNPDILRWWDGKCWSCAVHMDESADYAAIVATQEYPLDPSDILWTKRWWLNESE
jgi:hypothetical protein